MKAYGSRLSWGTVQVTAREQGDSHVYRSRRIGASVREQGDSRVCRSNHTDGSRAALVRFPCSRVYGNRMGVGEPYGSWARAAAGGYVCVGSRLHLVCVCGRVRLLLRLCVRVCGRGRLPSVGTPPMCVRGPPVCVEGGAFRLWAPPSLCFRLCEPLPHLRFCARLPTVALCFFCCPSAAFCLCAPFRRLPSVGASPLTPLLFVCVGGGASHLCACVRV